MKKLLWITFTTVLIGTGIVIDRILHKCSYQQIAVELKYYTGKECIKIQGLEGMKFCPLKDGSYRVTIKERKRR